MKLTGLFLIVLSVFLTACATNIPQAKNFESMAQRKAMAVQHWGMIATDAVERTKLALAKQAPLAGSLYTFLIIAIVTLAAHFEST